MQKDGTCDDGSSSNTTGDKQVWCDLGTDCTDCGAWTFQVPEGQAEEALAKPVEMLRDRQVKIAHSVTCLTPTLPVLSLA